jgi:hypothetical protein
MVLVFGALLAVSTSASFLLAFVGRIAEKLAGDELEGVVQLAVGVASLLVAFALSAGLFLFLYIRVPAHRITWKHALSGAVLAALLFEVLKIGFAQYAANFGNYDATYGSLGFVLLFLAFIYFTSQLMLLGAEAARATEEVAMGWPLPASESRVAAARAKVRALLAKVTRKPSPAAPPPPPPSITAAVAGEDEGATRGLVGHLRQQGKPAESGALIGFAIVMGLVVAAFRFGRGRR